MGKFINFGSGNIKKYPLEYIEFFDDFIRNPFIIYPRSNYSSVYAYKAGFYAYYDITNLALFTSTLNYNEGSSISAFGNYPYANYFNKEFYFKAGFEVYGNSEKILLNIGVRAANMYSHNTNVMQGIYLHKNDDNTVDLHFNNSAISTEIILAENNYYEVDIKYKNNNASFVLFENGERVFEFSNDVDFSDLDAGPQFIQTNSINEGDNGVSYKGAILDYFYYKTKIR